MSGPGESDIDSGHTAFMFVSMGLVQFMTPGLAFFYGGLVSKQNVVAMCMQSFISMGVVTMLWWAFVFSLCFGESINGLIGSPFTYPTFNNVGIHTPLMRSGDIVQTGIPGILYAGYQLMFAIVTPPLMSGAFADRFRFKPYVIFISLWIIIVYAPVCHWIWGGGWMSQIGITDWAGGLVVHTTAGFSALASLLFVGRRATKADLAQWLAVHSHQDIGSDDNEPHNIPLVALGTAALWFGWFGFNGGSSYLSNGAGILATINSQLAAAAAACVWLFIDAVQGRKPSLVNFCVGAVAGLAAITPAAGTIPINHAVLLGAMSGAFCMMCTSVSKQWNKFGFEDALDVWGVHGMGGFLGSVMIGVLADGQHCADATAADPTCANPGVVTRSVQQFMMQLSGATFIALYSFAWSYSILLILSAVMPIVPEPWEQRALDVSEHGEIAYAESAPPLSPLKAVPSEISFSTHRNGINGNSVAATDYASRTQLLPLASNALYNEARRKNAVDTIESSGLDNTLKRPLLLKPASMPEPQAPSESDEPPNAWADGPRWAETPTTPGAQHMTRGPLGPIPGQLMKHMFSSVRD